jgi:hypothetical protein
MREENISFTTGQQNYSRERTNTYHDIYKTISGEKTNTYHDIYKIIEGRELTHTTIFKNLL